MCVSVRCPSVIQTSNTLSAGQLNWFDPDTGETIVYNGGDIAWTLASTALVWIMVPGVGFFYSGLLRRKNGLSMIYLSVGTIAVVSFQVRANAAATAFVLNTIRQWFFWGFSLAFSDTANLFIGDLRKYCVHSFPVILTYSFLSCRLFWATGSSGKTLYWERPSSVDRFLCLPADVCCNYVCGYSLDHHIYLNSTHSQPYDCDRCCS